MELIGYLAAAIALCFTITLFAVCVCDRCGAAMGVEQNQQISQTGNVDQQRGQAQNSPLWFLTIGAFGIGFVAAVIFGYVNEFQSGGWTALFSLALVFCTLFQAAIAERQRGVMLQQIDLARDEMKQATIAAEAAMKSAQAAEATVAHMRIEQRAWVTFSKAEMHLFQDGKPISTKLHVNAIGLTPAFIDKQGAQAFVLPRSTFRLTRQVMEVEKALVDSGYWIEVVLAPSGEGHVFRDVHSDLDVNYQLIELLKYDQAIFLVGIVFYRDAFGREQKSVGCFRYSFEDQKFVGHKFNNKVT